MGQVKGYYKNTNKCSEYTKGEKTMTDNELQLIEMIRNHPEPDKALEAAVAVIVTFLKREEKL